MNRSSPVLLALGLAVTLVAPEVDAKPAPRHTVAGGDTLGAIAESHGCSVGELKRANKLKTDVIKVGQKLRIPKCTEGRAHEGKSRPITHTVTEGETLGGIAQHYGVTVKAIQSTNGITDPHKVKVGQSLTIVPRVASRAKRKFVYRVRASDNCSRIARRHGISVKELQRLNKKKTRDDCRKLRIGDKLWLYKDGPAVTSKSVGRPNAGRLVDGEQLPSGPGYYRRRPHRAWGTNYTIGALLDAIAAVRKKHPKVHDLSIGDLSDEDGGPLAKHKSHQSGRDADVGFYFKPKPSRVPKGFVSGRRHTLDLRPNWTFIRALVGKGRGKSKAEYIFLDYRLQERLYKWVKRKKLASSAELKRIFQYPRGRRALQGIIRHEPGHADHYHIRFECPRGAVGCD